MGILRERLFRQAERAPMLAYFGIELPTSLRQFDAAIASYVRVPTSSLDWSRAAEWTSPTSLDFTTTTIETVRLGAAVTLPKKPDPEQFARLVVRHMRHAVRGTEQLLEAREHVLDPEGLTVTLETRRGGELMLNVEGRAWPAVEGVTVPAKDATW